MNFHHRGNCGCPRRIVHPPKHNCVHCCTENVVEHIHPVHTTVMNHHLERHRHVFPHSTSEKNMKNCVDEFGGSCHMPAKQDPGCETGGCGNGMMHGGFGGYGPPNHQGHHQGQPHGHQHPQHWGHHHGEMNNWKKPNNWW